jgi:hypothetical protein
MPYHSYSPLKNLRQAKTLPRCFQAGSRLGVKDQPTCFPSSTNSIVADRLLLFRQA